MATPGNSGCEQRSAKLPELLEQFVIEYQPLLLGLVERRAAARLRGWAEDATDFLQKQVMTNCAEQKEEVASRIEALFCDAREIESQICQEVPAVMQLDDVFPADEDLMQLIALQANNDRICVKALQRLADEENREQARHALLSCAVLEENSARDLESMLSAIQQ
jgi:hypothetical protein